MSEKRVEKFSNLKTCIPRRIIKGGVAFLNSLYCKQYILSFSVSRNLLFFPFLPFSNYFDIGYYYYTSSYSCTINCLNRLGNHDFKNY